MDHYGVGWGKQKRRKQQSTNDLMGKMVKMGLLQYRNAIDTVEGERWVT